MVANHDVALVEILPAIDFQPVLHRHADRIGNKNWHAAGALGQQFSFGADEAYRVIFVFVDVRTECRARHIGIDLITDGNYSMPDHFQSYRIDRNSFQGLPNRRLAHSSTSSKTQSSIPPLFYPLPRPRGRGKGEGDVQDFATQWVQYRPSRHP